MVCMVSIDGKVLAISPMKFHHCCPLSCSPFMLPCISIYSYHFGQGLKGLVRVDTKSSSPQHPVSPLLLLLRGPQMGSSGLGLHTQSKREIKSQHMQVCHLLTTASVHSYDFLAKLINCPCLRTCT